MKYRIKPKPYVEAMVRSALPGLTKLCALERIPFLTFSKQQIKRLGLKRYSNLGNRYRGFAWSDKNVIYISPRIDAEQARKTLTHEFIHLRFPYLSHGKNFEEKMGRLLKGEQFKPRKQRATPERVAL